MTTIEDRITAHYAGLSDKLRAAADYIVANPLDVTTRSLRSVAGSSGVSPATFSRLARALGFGDYEELRELGRASMGHRLEPFSARARRMQEKAGQAGDPGFLSRQAVACIANIDRMSRTLDPAQLDAVTDRLLASRKVLLVGALGSTGPLEYFAYMAGWLADNWQVAGRNGVTLGAALSRLGPEDTVIVLSKAPYAKRSIGAARIAVERGARLVVIADSHAFPAVDAADHCFVLPTDSPHFFSSYAATTVFLEALVGMLVTRAGPTAETRIRDAEDQLRRLDEVEAT